MPTGSTIFLTGATGVVGSVVAEHLLAAGYEVRALVRPGTDPQSLVNIGVEIARGDVTDASSVLEGSAGCEAVIHCAALVGQGQQDIDRFRAVNVQGTLNVLDAAQKVGMRRSVITTSSGFLDRHVTLTEHSAVDPNPAGDPYTQTKKEAFVEVMRRAEEGQDVLQVSPGAMYGPSPLGQRAVDLPGADHRLVKALKGEPERYVPMRTPWTNTNDVAAFTVAALDRGVPGEFYLALGRQDCVMTIASFVNRALELAGSEHRVGELSQEELEDPEVLQRFGPTLVGAARRVWVEPLFDNRFTIERLGHEPLTLDDGLLQTLEWIGANSFS